MNFIDSIQISGSKALSGDVSIQGSKNAALPILAASILVRGEVILHNCPDISDITCMLHILKDMGCLIQRDSSKHTLIIDATNVSNSEVAAYHASGMRSSIFLLGALLGRMGHAILPYPGGCVIGSRPIDQHICALSKMNIGIETKEMLHASTDVIVGADITLTVASVGATENIILAAVTAKGNTKITNAAKEPEIVELCSFLKKAGALIQGEGSECILITGVDGLNPVEHRIVSDRIVAGTYALAAAATRGRICMKRAPVQHLEALFYQMRHMGCAIGIKDQEVLIDARMAALPIPYLYTSPYPGFPTDLQSQLLAALCIAKGESIIEETIFEGRFKVVDELKMMGANIMTAENIAHIKGVKTLHGATVQAKELRGGAALVLAGLIAEGETVITDAHYIARGYENICEDINRLGGSITEIRNQIYVEECPEI